MSERLADLNPAEQRRVVADHRPRSEAVCTCYQSSLAARSA